MLREWYDIWFDHEARTEKIVGLVEVPQLHRVPRAFCWTIPAFDNSAVTKIWKNKLILSALTLRTRGQKIRCRRG